MAKRSLGPALLLLLAAAGPAVATTIVPMPDAVLVDRSAVIVEVVVEAMAPSDGAFPSTAVTVRTERALKGPIVPGERLTVSQLGGRSRDGLVALVDGVTRLVPGERFLLFLRADGTSPAESDRSARTYRLADPVLGAFRDVPTMGLRLAWRDLSRVHQLGAAAMTGADPLRAYEAFRVWIGDRAAGRRRGADYLVPEGDGALRRAAEAASVGGAFTFLHDEECETGLAVRHFIFDSGGSFTLRALSSGQPGLAGGGFAEFQTGINLWNADGATPVQYVYDGTTGSTAACNNSIVFADAENEIPGTFTGSGTVALGGPCYNCTPIKTFNGDSFHQTVKVFIITQDGTDELFAGSQGSKTAEELFAHELGHTLGLGHTSVSSALMFAFLHNPRIGATLAGDDRAGLAKLYAGHGPPPNPKPAAPSNLVASALSPTSILLTWSDNSTNETSFRVEQDSTDDQVNNFSEVAQLSAGAESFEVTGLAVESAHRFRVRAGNANGFSAYSNVAPATTLDELTPPPPAGEWLETDELPGFRFKARITSGETVREGTAVEDCEPETLCVAGAIPDRAEAYLRVIGPRPNGFLWNQVIRFTVSEVEAWFEQLSTGTIRYYQLAGVPQDSEDLLGHSDKEGFLP